MSNAISTITAARAGRRRRFTPDQKYALLRESERPGNSISGIARAHGIAPSLLFKWKQAMDDASKTSLEGNEKLVPESELKKAQAKVRELERLAGKQAMKIEILEDAVRIGQEKKLISRGRSPKKGGGT